MGFNIMDWEIVTKEQVETTEYDAGVIVYNFDPATWVAPVEGTGAFLTTGNIGIQHVIGYTNLGDDINGIHFRYKEFEFPTGIETSQLTVTSLGFSAADIALGIGAAKVEGNKVSTDIEIDEDSFKNIAWVGHKVDGGWVACVIPYALSTGGLNITTTKGGKGQNQLTISAFRSIETKRQGEMEFYTKSGSGIKITKQPDNVTEDAGTAVEFSVVATGATGYQWQVCAVGDVTFRDISGKTTDTLELAAEDIIASASGNAYRCKLSSLNGTSYTKPAILTVE